jgi:hypothetical protein
MATIETANAKGNAGIALGSTAVGIELVRALSGNGGLQGLLGNLFGGSQNASGVDMLALMAMINAGRGVCCTENPISRSEFALEKENAAKDAEIALLKANIFGDQKDLEQQKYLDGKLLEYERRFGEQAVINQRTADSFERVHDDLMCVKGDLEGKIAAERAARCCSDNAIVTYANATFYPKMVADVTVGTTTTAQTLYNPVTNCGCGNGCGNG